MRGKKLALLSGLSDELNAATHLASVIQAATDSSADGEDISGALICLWKRLWDINSELEEIVDSEYDEKRLAANSDTTKRTTEVTGRELTIQEINVCLNKLDSESLDLVRIFVDTYARKHNKYSSEPDSTMPSKGDPRGSDDVLHR